MALDASTVPDYVYYGILPAFWILMLLVAAYVEYRQREQMTDEIRVIRAEINYARAEVQAIKSDIKEKLLDMKDHIITEITRQGRSVAPMQSEPLKTTTNATYTTPWPQTQSKLTINQTS